MDQSRMQRDDFLPTRQVSRRDYLDEEYDDTWPIRQSTSVRRYHSDVKTDAGRSRADVQQPQGSYYSSSYAGHNRHAIPARRTATQTSAPVTQTNRRRIPTTEDVKPRTSGAVPLKKGRAASPSKPQSRLLIYGVGAVLFLLVGWFLVNAVVNWWQVTQDDWHYGRPRTFQIDAIVGHNDSPESPSHFVALNLKGHIQIIEFPGGDSSKARVYTGPILTGQGQELAVVTLSFKDTRHDGKPAMIVSVQDSRFVFVNGNGTFRPARSGENV